MTPHLQPHRRLLSPPAVRPCESISPSVLIADLVALAGDISSSAKYDPIRYPTHRRIIRESLRIVSLLLVFFRSITRPHQSSVLALSELHVILQKLSRLLQDCSFRGAKLYVLVSSDRATSEFRILIRSVAVALDVLPLDVIVTDDDGDTKEMVKLLTRQAWKVEVNADADDDRAINSVRSALARFATGSVPDPIELTPVLDRLGIRSWSDCNEEVTFLEDELLDHSNGENGEAVLLGNLMGFIVYCRAVMFQHDAVAPKEKEFKKIQENGIGRLNSEAFRCPISLEIMTEPVTISTGQTYDKAPIVRWLKSGLLTCPVTGEKLKSAEFVPNSAVQRIVAQYCHHKNIAFVEPSSGRKRDLAKTSSPGSSAAAGATKMTAAFLMGKLSAGTEDEKNRAAYEIRLLSKSSIFHRACLVEADSVPWLLHLLSTSDPSTQDNAVAALLNLSKHPHGRSALFELGGIGLVVDAITDGLKVEVKQNATAILFYLSSVEEYRQEIGEIPEAIPALVNLLRRGSHRGKKNAVVALFSLLLFPGNLQKVLKAGATRALIDLLADDRDDLVNDCVGVLAKIAERQEGTSAILKASSDILPLLVGVLQSSSTRSGREYCVSIMLSLCNNAGPKVIGSLEKIHSLMPALYSVSAEGSPHASKKARSLINYIHQIHDQDCQNAVSPPRSVQEQVVHAR